LKNKLKYFFCLKRLRLAIKKSNTTIHNKKIVENNSESSDVHFVTFDESKNGKKLIKYPDKTESIPEKYINSGNKRIAKHVNLESFQSLIKANMIRTMAE